MDGGPAARSGLRVGDVILSLNGKPIVMSADLPHLVGALKPGSKARMEVVRDGDRKTLDVSIGAMPEEGEAVAASGGGQERSDNRLGVKVTELTEEQKKSLDLPGGVVITEILNGPAAMIGLRPGMSSPSEQSGDQFGGDVQPGCRAAAQEPLGFDARAASGACELHYLQAGRVSAGVANEGRLRPPFFVSAVWPLDAADRDAGGLCVALQGLISYTSRLFSAGNRPATTEC